MKLRRLPDASPSAEVGPSVEVGPSAEVGPSVEAGPSADARPVSRETAGSAHEFVLGQLQAADWVRLLEPRAEQGTGVARLRDDLEDALRLATWARSDVRIEVTASQIAEVLDMLVADSERFGQHELDVLGEILLTFSERPGSS